MARLVRIAKPARSSFDPRLSPEQEAARVAQSKADRKKTVIGVILRSTPNPKPVDRWREMRKARATETARLVEANDKAIAVAKGLEDAEKLRGAVAP